MHVERLLTFKWNDLNIKRTYNLLNGIDIMINLKKNMKHFHSCDYSEIKKKTPIKILKRFICHYYIKKKKNHAFSHRKVKQLDAYFMLENIVKQDHGYRNNNSHLEKIQITLEI